MTKSAHPTSAADPHKTPKHFDAKWRINFPIDEKGLLVVGTGELARPMTGGGDCDSRVLANEIDEGVEGVYEWVRMVGHGMII